MVKNLVSDPILAHFGPNLVPKIFLWFLTLLDIMHCCRLSLYIISRKTNETNLRKWQKPYQFQAQFWPVLALFRSQFFLSFATTSCYALLQAIIVQGIIQKKSASGSRTLPLVIFDKKALFSKNSVILQYFCQKCPFLKILDAVLKFQITLCCMQFQGKLMKQT